jgi:hypothetical protein
MDADEPTKASTPPAYFAIVWAVARECPLIRMPFDWGKPMQTFHRNERSAGYAALILSAMWRT